MSIEKILTPDELASLVQELRQKGQRVVTTNGCFDVLHVGHLRYLQAARAHGDALVVLLNSDQSVQGLKGPSRPIVPEEERAEMLAGLSCVSYVTLFDEPTPVNLLERIQPSVHVKGGDYTPETLPEAPLLQQIGTEMAFIPMIQGRSTTNIIRRILETHQPV